MRFYEVFIADARYRANSPLIYQSEEKFPLMTGVTVEVRKRLASGFVTREVDKPDFATKPIKALLSEVPLPPHCLELAQWLHRYYNSSLGEALRQFAPSRPVLRRRREEGSDSLSADGLQLEITAPLTEDQQETLTKITGHPGTTLLLHGETGTGKTRVYLELAKQTLASGRSAIILTPEIALTPQLALAAEQHLHSPTFVLHSQLSEARRKKIWLAILEAKEPVVVIGPRSALFSPIRSPGLIVVDEAHEPAYKQDQSPRYHASRVASQMGQIVKGRVILGTATPAVSDYHLAERHRAVVRMEKPAIDDRSLKTSYGVIDLKDRRNLTRNKYISDRLIDTVSTMLDAGKQVIIYLNRRGSARIILCDNCGWRLLCPNCDVPLVYHADSHLARCHICGFSTSPPGNCPECQNPDIIYKSIGTKALVDILVKLFPSARIRRFDSDNLAGERLNDVYKQVRDGKVDILVGTQLLAKGLDLPRLGLVGVIAAETTLSLPDFSAEERTFQLLYQIIGRVGRGHGSGEVVIQTYDPDSQIIQAAIKRDYKLFYGYVLAERQKFRFPPFSYLMQLTCRRTTLRGAQNAADRLKEELLAKKLPVEIIGPAPSFYARRGRYHYWQIVVKSKHRDYLLNLAEVVPADWSVNLDPMDLF
jgi:primosomal protein N' (replication factor Y)